MYSTSIAPDPRKVYGGKSTKGSLVTAVVILLCVPVIMVITFVVITLAMIWGVDAAGTGVLALLRGSAISPSMVVKAALGAIICLIVCLVGRAKAKGKEKK